MTGRAIEFPVTGLADGEIRLRLAADSDVDAIVDAVRDPQIPRFTRVPAPYDASDARQWMRAGSTGIAAGTDLQLVVADAGDDTVLGTVALHAIDPESGRCSAGYWVAAPARGRGIAAKALRLLCAYGFAELGLSRIELWIEPANVASLKVAEAAGFAREGLLRSFAPVDGRRRDMLMYSLLPGDLPQRGQATASGAAPGPNSNP